MTQIILPPESLPTAFLAVVRNTAFPDLRALEPLLGSVLRTLYASPQEWLKAREGLTSLTGVDLRRAAYLLDYVACSSEHVVPSFDDVLARCQTDAASAKYPWFHADSPAVPLMDELADLWGLSRGFSFRRVKQLLRPPYVC